MNLHSGELYWYKKDGLLNSYPSLDRNLKTDILILGAGISGALIAYYLIKENINVTLIDKRDAASGSTSASTSLLQYEIDTPLSDLIKKVGRKNAVISYLMCRDAIYKLQTVAKNLKSQSEFEIKQSIYLASLKKDVNELKNEFRLRKNAGIEVRLLDENELKSEFDLDAPAALVSKDGGQLNAYRFTHELLQWVKRKGGNIFDKTEAVKIKSGRRGVSITTDGGFVIQASHLVYANGYEALDYLKKPYGRLHSTYVTVSEPFKEKPFDYILWETARPYLYMRATSDNRIIAGGKDEVFYSPGLRDKLLTKKTQQILKSVQKKFPQIKYIPDYSWCGTFAETKDGLPYIGKIKEHPFSFFALGFGGNGITFSLIAAEIISDAILRKKNPGADIFSFRR